MKKAVDMYYAEHGTYPHTGTPGTIVWRYYCNYTANPADFIPAIASSSSGISPAPCNGGTTSDDTWIYGSDGSRYKLMYIRANVSSTFRDLVGADLRDPVRWGLGTTWGYWTSDARLM